MTAIESQSQKSSCIVIDTSTVNNEIIDNNELRKSNDSSIQINVNPRENLNEQLHEYEQNSSQKSSNDQQKFNSLVIAMTALKDSQKVEICVCFFF